MGRKNVVKGEKAKKKEEEDEIKGKLNKGKKMRKWSKKIRIVKKIGVGRGKVKGRLKLKEGGRKKDNKETGRSI